MEYKIHPKTHADNHKWREPLVQSVLFQSKMFLSVLTHTKNKIHGFETNFFPLVHTYLNLSFSHFRNPVSVRLYRFTYIMITPFIHLSSVSKHVSFLYTASFIGIPQWIMVCNGQYIGQYNPKTNHQQPTFINYIHLYPNISQLDLHRSMVKTKAMLVISSHIINHY